MRWEMNELGFLSRAFGCGFIERLVGWERLEMVSFFLFRLFEI
jgi:hypothetical protein